MKTESYEHHGRVVSVFSELKGKHREHCLCYAGCKNFKPGQKDNCAIAEENYAMCKKHGITTPVFECPQFAVNPMSQGFVSADGTRFILPNGYSRQLPHGGGPQGVKTWFFKPDGKIWPGCEGCQCDYTSNFSSCDQCPKALVAMSLEPEHTVVSEEKELQ